MYYFLPDYINWQTKEKLIFIFQFYGIIAMFLREKGEKNDRS